MNGTWLKVLAVALMCIDHVGAALFPYFCLVRIGGGYYSVLRVIGRLSFPVFAFLLAQGAVYTSNWKKYALRLLLLFLMSECIYDRLFHGSWFFWENQNILLTLLLGLLAIEGDLRICGKMAGSGSAVARLFLMGGICVLAELLGADYGAGGILMIYGLYACRESVWGQCLVLLAVNGLWFGGIQFFGALAWIFILLYDGTPGTKNRLVRDGFYLFYPVHLVLLLMASMWL